MRRPARRAPFQVAKSVESCPSSARQAPLPSSYRRDVGSRRQPATAVKYDPLEDSRMSAPRWFPRLASLATPAAVLIGGASLVAQAGSAWVMPATAPENAALRNMHWRSIGPA